ncbi:MAG: hypothetical protein V3T33_00760, partial [Myxococcota bacterium]
MVNRAEAAFRGPSAGMGDVLSGRVPRGGAVLEPHPPHQQLLIVPHTHWDREWYRTHEEFRTRLVRLVDTVLDLLERDPAFRHFTLDGQTVVLDDYLEVRPQARERIAKLAQAGRLHIGPWYVLPDEWLVSGEALIRNLRLGLRCADALGGAMRLGYVPDQFGHVGQLPQIFSSFGFEAAVLWRGVGADVRETLFNWESPDGTRLLTVYLVNGYSNAGYLPGEPGRLASRLRGERDRLARRSRVSTLLLMNGNDHAEPDPGLPESLAQAANQLPGLEIEIGSLPEYVRRVGRELPRDLVAHRGELRSGLRSPLLAGCASARMPQKRADFENDRRLTRDLEPLSAWLGALGGETDLELIDFTWRIALQNHPHDSICGCSIDAVHDQMDARFARVAELASAQLERVFGDLARRIALPPGAFGDGFGARFAVWNPNPAGSAPVEVCLESDEDAPFGPMHVRRVDGTRLPAQVEELEASSELLHLELPSGFARDFLERDFPDFLGYWLQDLQVRREGAKLIVVLRLGRLEPRESRLSEKRLALGRALAADGVERVEVSMRRRGLLRLRFIDRLPGYGLRIYQLQPGRAPLPADLASQRLALGGAAIQNAHWRVEVDSRGRVTLIRRIDGRRIDDAIRLVSEADRGDEYTFDPVPGAEIVERPEWLRTGLVRSGRFGPSVALRLRGRYRVPASLDLERRNRLSKRVGLPVDLEIRLWTDLDRIDVSAELDNRARDHRLRLFLRAPFEARRFEVESAFEVAAREIAPVLPSAGERQPAEHPSGATPQRCFASLDDGQDALTVANRGLAEVEAVPEGDGTTSLAVTVLRAVGWLSRGDLVMRPGPAGPPLPTP